jgi:hypothetical protein
MNKLQNAAFEIFISGIKAAKGGGNSLLECLKEYGFTGPFAGFDNYYENIYELAEDLEQFIK